MDVSEVSLAQIVTSHDRAHAQPPPPPPTSPSPPPPRYVRKVTVDDLTGNITLSDPVKTNLDAIRSVNNRTDHVLDSFDRRSHILTHTRVHHNHHRSRFFPYPFRWEENWYILNGFDLAGGIPGIYKCTSFPETWELVHAVPAALGTHTHAIVRGGKLYIFVPWDGDDGEHELKLYVADSPTAGWNEHPSSPLYKGVPWGSHAGGGAAVEHDGRLYRLVQDCRGWYGQCVRAFEVTELSETMFSEMLVSGAPLAGAVGEGAAAVGMHVVSHAQLASGMWLRASDAWKTHSTSATTVPPPLSSPPPPPSSSTAAPEPPHPFPQRAFMMGQDFLPEVRQELVKRSIPVVDLVTPRDAANWSELLRAELQLLGLGATDVVVALPNWVDVALEVLGIAVPVPPDYPECLAHLLQRKVWQSSLGDVEAALGAGEHTQLFIKPAEGAKAFSGTVVHGPADGMLAMLLDTSIFPACGAALAVHCSEVKEMNSEYAVYVVDGKIRSICHYMCKTSTCRCENGERAAAGDAVIQLDMGVVHEAVQLLADCDAMRALTGYRADFALVRKETGADGTGGGVDAGDSYVTALVEVNDGYVSGRYDSMLPSDFTDMIVSRFRSLQLTIAAAP